MQQIHTSQSKLLTPTEGLFWFAVKTVVGSERPVAETLARKGYDQFLPAYRTRRRWSDRNKEVSIPYFPGYVFCRLEPGYWLPALKTPGVQYLVGYGKKPVPIDESEIESIRTVVQSGFPAGPCPFLRVGDRARVIDGPLCGLEGFLVRFKGGWRVVVSVTLLGRSLSVEVDGTALERVSAPGTRPTGGMTRSAGVFTNGE